jgi:hypothetical protein
MNEKDLKGTGVMTSKDIPAFVFINWIITAKEISLIIKLLIIRNSSKVLLKHSEQQLLAIIDL